jgi:hypothetical protein
MAFELADVVEPAGLGAAETLSRTDELRRRTPSGAILVTGAGIDQLSTRNAASGRPAPR